jgi:hypothetical protein
VSEMPTQLATKSSSQDGEGGSEFGLRSPDA